MLPLPNQAPGCFHTQKAIAKCKVPGQLHLSAKFIPLPWQRFLLYTTHQRWPHYEYTCPTICQASVNIDFKLGEKIIHFLVYFQRVVIVDNYQGTTGICSYRLSSRACTHCLTMEVKETGLTVKWVLPPHSLVPSMCPLTFEGLRRDHWFWHLCHGRSSLSIVALFFTW